MSILDDLKNTFSNNNSLPKLIVINAILFVLINILNLISENFYLYFSLPSTINSLLHYPWTLLTYMFTHKDFFHFLFNMLWLYWMGIIALDFLGSKRLVAIYILGGLSGGVLFLLSYLIVLNGDSPMYLLGASGAVMAVVVAIATLVPDYEIILLLFGRVKLKYLALASFVITTLIDLNVNTGGKIAHLGGALFGLTYTFLYKRGTDLSIPITKFLLLFDRNSKLFEKKSKMKVVYKNTATAQKTSTISQTELQEKTDIILDKISKSGYESLTAEEKDILFKASRK
ncbi:MAG: rhomboid family intramembrane serine protease [Bacteroidetes bacterium]|nr:rhomboid family intramembrane serine protease [Bacteroidota bacterium]